MNEFLYVKIRGQGQTLQHVTDIRLFQHPADAHQHEHFFFFSFSFLCPQNDIVLQTVAKLLC